MKKQNDNTKKIFSPSLLDTNEYDDAVIGAGSIATHTAVVEDETTVSPSSVSEPQGELLVKQAEEKLEAQPTQPADNATTTGQPAQQSATQGAQRGYVEEKEDKTTPILWGSA